MLVMDGEEIKPEYFSISCLTYSFPEVFFFVRSSKTHTSQKLLVAL